MKESDLRSTAFKMPSAFEMAVFNVLAEPLYRLHRPVFRGMEQIPVAGPLLFVGNHTLYGVIDAPLLFFELYKQRHIFIRALGDRLHFKIPLWRSLLSKYGVVEGSPENCAKLMSEGQAILVFPGGAREVAKKKGEKYQLLWKSRVGFARMAIKHQCTIVPFAALGVEDMFDIVMDSDELMSTPMGFLLREMNIRKDLLLPLCKGSSRFALPSLERFYFQFGQPISPANWLGRHNDHDACWELREQVKTSIEDSLRDLKETQKSDPDRWIESPVSRWRGRVLKGVEQLKKGLRQGK